MTVNTMVANWQYFDANRCTGICFVLYDPGLHFENDRSPKEIISLKLT